MQFTINKDRLLRHLQILGDIGRDEHGQLTRLAASQEDKLGRDQLVTWILEAGFDVLIDRIGNIFGLWADDDNEDKAPIMLGSHIDSVINAGIFDGTYGVLSALEVMQSLKENGFKPKCPIIVAAFTNEEGVRFAPDMMGSLVYCGGLDIETALATKGTDGKTLGEELQNIGYAGDAIPGFITPLAYLELHIEQGPILEKENFALGVVDNLQGISWQKITIQGIANHAGTTPMTMRCDAGYGAAQIINFLHDYANSFDNSTVATVGTIAFEPNAINVIPSKAEFTVDMRNPDENKLQEFEKALKQKLGQLANDYHFTITTEKLARFEPVTFDQKLVALIEKAAQSRQINYRHMTSGAGHDAQMMARIAPSAMIFVPSKDGISHNPLEYTFDHHLIIGATILLDSVCALTNDYECLNEQRSRLI